MHVEKIEEEVIRLATEFPDLVYEKAVGNAPKYTYPVQSNGGSGCLIGQAIQNLYPELKEKLEIFDKDNMLVDPLTEHLFNEKCSIFLVAAQSRQDYGYSWGVAVDKAYEDSGKVLE